MWQITFLPEAKKELFKLDKQIQKIVLAGIRKVSKTAVKPEKGFRATIQDRKIQFGGGKTL